MFRQTTQSAFKVLPLPDDHVLMCGSISHTRRLPEDARSPAKSRTGKVKLRAPDKGEGDEPFECGYGA